eukprot:442641_1
MASPSRTTFEVKVSNKLIQASIWVKVAAELNYATQLQSSSHQHQIQNTYNKTAFANTAANTRYNKTHDKSIKSDSQSQSQSHSSSHMSSNITSKNTSAGASYGGFGASLNVNNTKSHQSASNTSGTSASSSSHFRSNDNLNETKSSDHNSANNLKEESKQNTNTNQSSSNATLTNKIIDPGFVRITPLQSLSIPVIVENESQVVYITVYCSNDECERIVIANQLQINRQLVEIRRNKITNDIEIAPESETNGKYTNYRKLLLEWGLPEYLCDAMKNCGWHNPKYWDDITERHLIEMGFKAGHRIIFNNEYIKYKMKKDIIKNQLSYKNLLKEWNIPIYLFDNMKENGWDDLYLWHKIDDNDLKQMQFKKGHIEKFKKYVNKNNDHIKQFETMIERTKQNKAIMDDYNDDDEYATPNAPLFTVNNDKITNNSFEIELKTINKSESYLVEIDENNSYEWKLIAEIKQKKCHKIKNLKMNTNYSIRIKAQTAFKRSEYSKVIKVQTMGEKWIKENSKQIPALDYHVANNNCNVWISFMSKELQKINVFTKYNEIYYMEIGLSVDDEKEPILKWQNIGQLRKDTSCFSYNISNLDDGKMKIVNTRILSKNDLGYMQYSSNKTFKINKISEEQNKFVHTKHSNTSWFNVNSSKTKATRTRAWKTDYENGYNTFAVGIPITNYICNKYDVHLKKFKTQWFGYCVSKDGQMNKWGTTPGEGDNKQISYALCVGYNNSFMYYGPKHRSSKQTYHDCPNYTIPSEATVILSFDFVNDELKMYANDKSNLLKTMSLDGHKVITPLFSLADQEQSVEVLKCKLYG